MSAIPFYKSVYETHFLAGDSGRSRGLDHRAMPGAPVSYRLIGISRYFSTNLGVSRFPDSTCENPEFLFRFEIGKTKGRVTLLHGRCLQT